jgi:hypothetical protein
MCGRLWKAKREASMNSSSDEFSPIYYRWKEYLQSPISKVHATFKVKKFRDKTVQERWSRFNNKSKAG